MMNLSFNVKCWDKKYFLAFLITLLCSIICGIVLYKPVTTNVYIRNLGADYVFNVFNFNNTPLFFTHLIGDVLYFYIFFLLCYYTKLRYLTLVFLYLRGLFFGIYVVVLLCANSIGGILAAIFVFIPATLISVAVCYVLTEICKSFDKRYCLLVPLIISLIDGVVLMLLVNVVFRVVIIIV